MAASARLDADLGKFRDLVGVDFEVAKTGKLKQLPVGCLALAQLLLHLAQHLVHANKLKDDICVPTYTKSEAYIKALGSLRTAGQVMTLA